MKYSIEPTGKKTQVGKVIMGLALTAGALTILVESRKLNSNETRKTLRSVLKGFVI